jgi:hypothetical protein
LKAVSEDATYFKIFRVLLHLVFIVADWQWVEIWPSLNYLEGSFFDPSLSQPSISRLKSISKMQDLPGHPAPEEFCYGALLTTLFARFRAGGYLNEMIVINLVFAFSLLPTEPSLPFEQCRYAVRALAFGVSPFHLFAPARQRLGPFPS